MKRTEPKKRIALSLPVFMAMVGIAMMACCALGFALGGCVDQSGVIADDQPDQATRPEPGPTDTSGVVKAEVKKKIVLLQIEGVYADWSTLKDPVSGKYKTVILSDSPPLVDVQDLGQLYNDLDPESLESQLVPPICLPGSGGVCPTWPSRTGSGGCICRIGPPMTGCCPFGPDHRGIGTSP